MIYFDEFVERLRSELRLAGDPPPTGGTYFKVGFINRNGNGVVIEVLGLAKGLSLRYRKSGYPAGSSSPWVFGKGLWRIQGVSKVGKVLNRSMTVFVEDANANR